MLCLNWGKGASFLCRWTFALINKCSLMIFSVMPQLSQPLTCERERGAMTAGVNASVWERRPEPRDPEGSAPGLYRVRSERAHQYSSTAPTGVPGDRRNKVAEVTHFTSRRESEQRQGRSERKFQAKREQREAITWRVEPRWQPGGLGSSSRLKVHIMELNTEREL